MLTHWEQRAAIALDRATLSRASVFTIRPCGTLAFFIEGTAITGIDLCGAYRVRGNLWAPNPIGVKQVRQSEIAGPRERNAIRGPAGWVCVAAATTLWAAHVRQHGVEIRRVVGIIPAALHRDLPICCEIEDNLEPIGV